MLYNIVPIVTSHTHTAPPSSPLTIILSVTGDKDVTAPRGPYMVCSCSPVCRFQTVIAAAPGSPLCPKTTYLANEVVALLTCH